MIFPWRKVKSGRISRFVNDHLDNSRKRRDGSSLVVETGFPTSLIYLFMKNREKLKKPSKKKTSNNKSSVDAEVPLPGPLPQTPSVHSVAEEIPAPVAKSDGVSSNSVTMDAFKLFLVVFLLLGTNKLSIGISISAFLLYFPDHLAISVLQNLLLCLEKHQILKSSDHGVAVVFESMDSPAPLAIEIQPLSESAQCCCSEIALEKKEESKRVNMKSRLRKLFSRRSQKWSDPRKIKQPNQTQNNREPESESLVAVKDENKAPVGVKARETVKETEYTSIFLFGFIVIVGIIAANRAFAVVLTVLCCLLRRFGEVLKLSFMSKFMRKSVIHEFAGNV